MDYVWEDWQKDTIDNYILGFTQFNTQQDLAHYLGKNLNAVKIKLTRRRKELMEEKRTLTQPEYIIFLANRFSLSTEEMADKLNLSNAYLLDELDEIDCLECKDLLMKDFEDRPSTNDEYEIFVKMHKKKRSPQYMSHILNRRITFIQELIKDYERI